MRTIRCYDQPTSPDLGAGDGASASTAAALAISANIAIGVVLGLIYVSLRANVVKPFTDDQAVQQLAYALAWA